MCQTSQRWNCPRVLPHVSDITALAAQAFCWLCGHATGYQHTWSEIDNHSCGRYREEADKRIDQAQRNNKRYQHYCLRWCVCSTAADSNVSILLAAVKAAVGAESPALPLTLGITDPGRVSCPYGV